MCRLRQYNSIFFKKLWRERSIIRRSRSTHLRRNGNRRACARNRYGSKCCEAKSNY